MFSFLTVTPHYSVDGSKSYFETLEFYFTMMWLIARHSFIRWMWTASHFTPWGL